MRLFSPKYYVLYLVITRETTGREGPNSSLDLDYL